jgi:hypothetical protein
VLNLELHLPICDQIPSDQPLLFNRLLLAGVATTPGLGHKEHLKLMSGVHVDQPSVALAIADDIHASMALEDGYDDDIFVSVGSVVFDWPIETATSKSTAVAISYPGSGAASSSSGGLAIVPVVSGDDGLAPPKPRSLSSSSSDSGSASSSSSDSDIAVGGHVPKRWYDVPGGGRVQIESYKPKAAALYTRWILKCPLHAKCLKKRSVSANNCSCFGLLE